MWSRIEMTWTVIISWRQLEARESTVCYQSQTRTWSKYSVLHVMLTVPVFQALIRCLANVRLAEWKRLPVCKVAHFAKRPIRAWKTGTVTTTWKSINAHAWWSMNTSACLRYFCVPKQTSNHYPDWIIDHPPLRVKPRKFRLGDWLNVKNLTAVDWGNMVVRPYRPRASPMSLITRLGSPRLHWSVVSQFLEWFPYSNHVQCIPQDAC